MSWEWGSVVQKEDHSPGTSRIAPAGPVSASPWCCSKKCGSGTGGAAEPGEEVFDRCGIGAAGLAPAADVALEIRETAEMRVEEGIGVLVAARTLSPVTTTPVIAGSVMGVRSSSQQRKAVNIGERLSQHLGSMGWMDGVRDSVSGMARLQNG